MSLTATASVAPLSRSQKALYSSPSSLVQYLAQSCQVPVASILDAYPPSPLQSSMFAAFLSSSPLNPLYVARLVFSLCGDNKDPTRSQDLDLERFQRAWNLTIQRNEILRTRLVQAPNGKEYLVVLNEHFTCRFADGVSSKESFEADGRLEMDYGRPLSRWSLLQGGKYFILTISHVIYDGWSLPLILSDFAEAWKLSSDVVAGGQGLCMSPRPSFKTFIRFLRRERAERWTEAADFWKDELSRDDEPVQFPQANKSDKADGPMTSAVHSTSVTLSWPLPSHSPTQLPTSSPGSEGVLYSTFIWAAWAMVLWRHTDSSSVLFGATLNGRRCPVPGIESITGPTMTTVPVMIGIDGQMTVGDFLQHLQNKGNRIAEYGWVGLQDIMRTCRKDMGKLNSILVIQPISSPEEGEEGNFIDSISRQAGWAFDESKSSAIQHNIGICLICNPSESGITINLQFDPSLKTETEISWLVGQFTGALEQLLRADNRSLQLEQLRISGPEEMQQIQAWNSKSVSSVDECLHDLFQSQATARGDAEAILTEAGGVTYKQLDALSLGLARFLHGRDLGERRMVPIAFGNSWLAIVAILAVLRAGACFVPIHPSTPRERVASITQQADARILICSEVLLPGLQEYGLPGIELLELTGVSISAISDWSSKADIVLPKVSPSALAYTYFTSGTTGVPKGVCMSHRASSTGNAAYGDLLSLTPSSRVLQFASLSFDVSCLEIFATLLSGACICIPSPEDRLQNLHSAIKRLRCNVVVLTPTVAKLLQADYMRDPTPIDTLCLTGEPLTASDVDFWAPKTRLLNGYGPTETCFCTFSRALGADSSAGNIGYGTACNTWIVDESGTGLAPLGTKGELFIEGPILADGYLGDAQKTRELFTKNPPWLPGCWIETGRQAVAYKTGDAARYNPDGSIECLGRKDAQVKLRGMRVDLGDVENAASSLGDKAVVLFPAEGPAAGHITAVVAFGRSGGTGDMKMLPSPGSDPATITRLLDLRRHIGSMVPPYMQPTVWVPIDCFPMLTSAKVSRLAVKSFVTHELVEDWLCSWRKVLSRTDLENRTTIQPGDALAIDLAGLIEKLIGTGRAQPKLGDGVEMHDLVLSRAGLDSVKAIQLMQLISKRYNVTTKLGQILGGEMTIVGLARHVEKLQTHANPADCDATGVVDLVDEYRSLAAILDDHSAAQVGQRSKVSDTVSTVFTTGATGYLGIEILHQLLEQPGITKVIALVRAPSMEGALRRLTSAAERMGWSVTPHLSKLEIWLGDLSTTDLGLSSAHWEQLHGGCAPDEVIDAVIHAGATVDWTRSYHQLKAVNVSSTLILLNSCTKALAKTGMRPRFIQISGGRAPKSELDSSSWETEALQLARALSAPTALGYTQTKLLSDLLVCKWASLCGGVDGGGVRVVMPGFIIGGGPNAVANMDDVLWRLVATNIGLGMHGCEVGNRWVYLASSAAVARKVLRLLARPRSAGQALTLPVSGGIPETAFWSLVSRAGYPLAGTDYETWLAAVDAAVEARGVRHPLYPVLHFVKQGVGIGGEPPAKDTDGCEDEEVRAEAERDVVSNLAYMRRIGFLPDVLVP